MQMKFHPDYQHWKTKISSVSVTEADYNLTFFIIIEIVIFKYKILSRDKFTHILEVDPPRILASFSYVNTVLNSIIISHLCRNDSGKDCDA